MNLDEEQKVRLEAIHDMLSEEDDKEEKDQEDSEEEKDEKEDEKEKNENFSDHLAAMFADAELSEETQEKIKTLFESAVAYEAGKKAFEIKTQLEEEKEAAIAEAKQELEEQADAYLTYVVEEWTKKNEVALQSQIKTNLMESFIVGLKNLFLEHNFNIPDEEVNMSEALMSRVEDLQGDVLELAKKNAAISEELDQTKRKLAFKTISEGMTEMDVVKLEELSEGKTYETAEAYQKGLSIIKESYFKQKEEEPVQVIAESTTAKQDDQMMEYASFLSRKFRY